MLHSRIRIEEKHLLAALRRRGVEVRVIDIRRLTFSDRKPMKPDYAFVLMRCMSHSYAEHTSRWFEHHGVRTLSSSETIRVCGDKTLMSLALQSAGVPHPRTAVALSAQAALSACEKIGYPVVSKPPIGSWGRQVSRMNDRDAAEAVMEHREAAGGGPFYLQAYLPQRSGDVRALVVGDETICAVRRNSAHWICNTARGATTTRLAVSEEIDRLAQAAARAVGGEIVAVDLLETEDGYVVNEVNHTPEFHGAMEAADIDIAGRMADYVLGRARGTS